MSRPLGGITRLTTPLEITDGAAETAPAECERRDGRACDEEPDERSPHATPTIGSSAREL